MIIVHSVPIASLMQILFRTQQWRVNDQTPKIIVIKRIRGLCSPNSQIMFLTTPIAFDGFFFVANIVNTQELKKKKIIKVVEYAHTYRGVFRNQRGGAKPGIIFCGGQSMNIITKLCLLSPPPTIIEMSKLWKVLLSPFFFHIFDFPSIFLLF